VDSRAAAVFPQSCFLGFTSPEMCVVLGPVRAASPAASGARIERAGLFRYAIMMSISVCRVARRHKSIPVEAEDFVVRL
jgi:hypothetical protein